jgi:DNA-binding winged helix-turn-helix (wHTH) protein
MAAVRFGPFVLDLDTRQLRRDTVDVHLTPKAFELLAVLVAERPRALAKSTLLDRLWPGAFVVEANLSNLVAEIRTALVDDARNPRWIRTLHGFGYAFCGEVIGLTTPRGAVADRPRRWLEWGQRRFPLTIGEHIVGRDPGVEVRLDAAAVSRRHARLVVTAERAVIEDIGSKNGTRRGDHRVTSPTELADGDVIHIGSVLLTFHQRRGTTTTVTHARSRPDSA